MKIVLRAALLIVLAFALLLPVWWPALPSALALLPRDGPILTGFRLRYWMTTFDWTRPTVEIDGVSYATGDDEAVEPMLRYFSARPDNTLLLPADYALKATKAQKECAENLRANNYKLRSPDPMVSLPADLTWAEDPFKDRNWQLQLHRWNFADCLMKGYVATKDEWFVDRLKWLVADWTRDNVRSDPASPTMSWYDHAIPIRMFNASRMLEFLKRVDRLDGAIVADILSLIALHANILADETTLYKIGHNHGMDQSFRLLQAANFFKEFENAEHWRKTALQRIEYETKVAMTSEGVHFENSPMYHDGITSYILKMHLDMAAMGERISGDFDRVKEGAIRFTAIMTRPDGVFPAIGDTSFRRRPRGDYPGVDYEKWVAEFRQNTPETEFLLPESGYYIYRSGWQPEATHLVMKCAFLSTGHRHSDDGNIVLFAFGEDWLIDSGMYGYPPEGGEEYHLREIVMAPQSHNLTAPVGAEVQRSPTGSGLSRESGETRCKSPMFIGYDYERTLSVGDDGSISVHDAIEREDAAPADYRTIFRVPTGRHVEIGEREVVVWNADRSRKMTIAYPDSVQDVRVATGVEADPPAIETVAYRKVRDAQAIVFTYAPSDAIDAEFRISVQ